MAGTQSYGNLIRGIFHEFIHAQLLLGVLGNFGALDNRSANGTAVHETIARYYLLTNGSLPYMCYGNEIPSTARRGIEYYNSIPSAEWQSRLSYMCVLFDSLKNER